MMQTLDNKGKPIGLDYDYEYRGRKREAFRDAPLLRSKITFYTLAGILFLGGVFVMVQYFLGKSNGTLTECITIFFFMTAIAALLCYVFRMSSNKHYHLLKLIREHKRTMAKK